MNIRDSLSYNIGFTTTFYQVFKRPYAFIRVNGDVRCVMERDQFFSSLLHTLKGTNRSERLFTDQSKCREDLKMILNIFLTNLGYLN